MADKVQKKLEGFVDDLQLLNSQNLLTLPEIKKIIKKRRKFEFDILNVDPDLSLISYKNYINYEIKLNKLIKSRFNGKYKNRIAKHQTEEDDEYYVGLKSNYENDRLKLKRYVNNNKYVFNIFNKCINRFVNNVEVYNMYLKHCKRLKSKKLFEKVIVKSLSKNPNNEKLWLILGSFLLKNKGLVFSKNIIQKSLRILPDNLNLILYFFQLEVKSFLIIFHEKITNKKSGEHQFMDKPELEGSTREVENILNKLYVIFEYGYNNLKDDKLTIFYFSVLNTLNQLIKFDLAQLDKLFDKINDLISQKSIPIISLYNHQVKLLEILLLILYNNSNDINSHSLSAELDLELEAIIGRMHDPDFLVLFLQFLCNIFNYKPESATINNSKDQNVQVNQNVEVNNFNNVKVNNFNNVEIEENDLLVSKYCHLENIYYVCLLGSPPSGYTARRCSHTSNLVNLDQLNYKRNLFNKYFNIAMFNYDTEQLGMKDSENERICDISTKVDLWQFLLDLKLEDVNTIYYYLKLLFLLSTINLNPELETSIHRRMEDLVKQLGTLKDITNDPLLHLLLQVNVDYALKKKVLSNFRGVTRPEALTASLLTSGLSAEEIVQVFVMFSKWGDEDFFKNFLNSFSQRHDVNLLYYFVLSDPEVRRSQINLCNSILTHLVSVIDRHLENFEANSQPIRDFLGTLNSVPKRLKLTNVTRNLIDSVNLKLNLLNFSTIELISI